MVLRCIKTEIYVLCVALTMPFAALQSRCKALLKQWGCTLWRSKDPTIKSLGHLTGFDYLVSWVGITVDTHGDSNVDKYGRLPYLMVLQFSRRFLLGHEPARRRVLDISVPQKVKSSAVCVCSVESFYSVGPFSVSSSWSGPSRSKMNQLWSFMLN